jgi:hypothetical protein
MFEQLQKLDREQAISVVYYSIRLLKHLERLKRGYSLSEAILPLPEADEEDARLVPNVVREIEAMENLKLEDLPQEKVEFYIITLSELILERNRKELNLDPERGRKLLQELREADFAAPMGRTAKTSN